MKHIDLTEFKDELQQKSQTVDLDNTTFEQLMDQFDYIARTIVEKHAPMIQWRKKEGELDWIALEYKKNRALRRRQERIWNKHRTADKMNKYLYGAKGSMCKNGNGETERVLCIQSVSLMLVSARKRCIKLQTNY